MQIKMLLVSFGFIVPFWILESLEIVPSYLFIPWLIMSIIIQTVLSINSQKTSFQVASDLKDGMFKKELALLPAITIELSKLGFRLCDKFYYSGASTSIVNAYLHDNNSEIFLVYTINGRTTFECVTEFLDDYSLNTCSTINSASVPKPHNNFCCIENTTNVSKLYFRHKSEKEFLISKGYSPIVNNNPNIREVMKDSNDKYFERTAKIKLFSIKILYWVATGRGSAHIPSLMEQEKRGIISV